MRSLIGSIVSITDPFPVSRVMKEKEEEEREMCEGDEFVHISGEDN